MNNRTDRVSALLWAIFIAVPIILKLSGYLDISWWLVLFPVWIAVGSVLIVAIAFTLGMLPFYIYKIWKNR